MSTGPLNSSAPSTSTVVGGVYNVASPAPLAGQEVALQLDVNGNLLVNIAAGSVGGGVQYADGATQVTPTGTVALGKNPSNILHALGLSAAGNLNVNLAEGSISGGNAAASPTGAAVPASADYSGVNIGGNLVGVTGLALGGTTKAPTVAIVDGSGNQITTFGGGTQFADNAASGATPTGTLSMGWDSANSKVRALKVDASQNLDVSIQNASIAVTGTFFQGTQPVSIAAAVDVSDRSARLLGHVTIDNATLAVTESGTWNVNQAIGVAGFEKITDGTNTAAVKAASTAAVATDTALVVAISPNNSVAVTGTFFQGTQPVSIAAAVDVSDRSARLLGHVTMDNATLAVTESGLWNVNQEIGVAGFEKITDGTNTAAVKAASTAAVATDPALVVAISPNNSVAVTGTFFQGTQPVSIAAAVDVSDRSARLLGHVTVDNASLAVTGTFFQATQPVSIAGTVNVSVQNATLAVTQSTSPWVENVSQFGGNPVVTGTGTSGVGIPRVTVSSDSFPVSQIVSQATGTNLHVVVDAAPAVTVAASSPIDEYGNKQMVAEDVFPWRQSLLDEMRAVRLGMQTLCDYMHPASGTPGPTNVSPLSALILRSTLQNTEVDLITLAQSIRDGSDEVIQG